MEEEESDLLTDVLSEDATKNLQEDKLHALARQPKLNATQARQAQDLLEDMIERHATEPSTELVNLVLYVVSRIEKTDTVLS